MEEVNEHRDSSSWLANELEEMISLNEKLAATSDDADQPEAGGAVGSIKALSQRKRSQLVEHLKELRLKNKSRLKASEFMLINRRSVSSHQAAAPGRRRTPRASRSKRDASLFDELESSDGPPAGKLPTSMSGYSSQEEEDDDDDESPNRTLGDSEWSEQIALEVLGLLRKFHAALQHRRDAFLSQSYLSAGQLSSPNSADDSGISADDSKLRVRSAPKADDKLLTRFLSSRPDDKVTGEQAKDVALWRALLGSLKSLIEDMVSIEFRPYRCAACHPDRANRDSATLSRHDQPCSSCQLMIGERAEFEQLRKLHARLSEEMRRKSDELLALSVAKTEQDTKLAALEERCAILSNDLSNCDKPKEDIVKLAWKARDEAVERKNNAEISLAKTRIENMQISSQLMEVVQQKGELSQKLAQFEVSFNYLLPFTGRQSLPVQVRRGRRKARLSSAY